MSTTTYKPTYDTSIRKETVVRHEQTMHVNYIDWNNYPFGDPEHTRCLCRNEEGKREHIEKMKEYLRICEKFRDGEVHASTYGGWPRIWQRVIGVGMASQWPYWKPRPVVVVHSTLGTEWLDWNSLTGAESR